MPITWTAQDTAEPIAATTIQGIANFGTYGVTIGCALTYSAANLNVTVAAGTVRHNGTQVTVAGNSVTLVADTTNPRWTWISVNSSGTAIITSGTAAATPTVPSVGDNVPLALVYVQANLSIANNATYKLDKRVFSGPDVQTFTGSGTWTKPPYGTVTVVRIYGGGGGGAGGFLTSTSYAVTAGSPITVTVGGGGTYGTVGSNSVFGAITATGGGRGGGGRGGR